MFKTRNSNSNKFLRSVFVLVLFSMIFVTLPSCARMFGEKNNDVTIESLPTGASIYIDGKECGITPATVNIPSLLYGGKEVILKKEGYEDQSLLVNTMFQSTPLLNGAIPASLSGVVYSKSICCPGCSKGINIAAVPYGVSAVTPFMMIGYAVDGEIENLVNIDPANSTVTAKMKKVEDKVVN